MLGYAVLTLVKHRLDNKMYYPASVLLSHIHKAEGTVSVHGSSGVIITDNWILTHASVLHPGTCGTAVANFLKNVQPNKLTVIPQNLRHFLSFRALWENSGSFVVREGFVAVTWTCSRLQTTFVDVLQSWSIGRRRAAVDNFAAIFLLINLNSKSEFCSNEADEAKKVLQLFYKGDLGCPTIGSDAEVISTPFGFPPFLNSVTRGIISNIVNDCFFITDASTTAGSEGAPVYLWENKKRYLFGLVISLSHDKQSFTFGVSLLPSLKQILHDENKSNLIVDNLQKGIANKKSSFYDLITRSVVAVRCGVNWGTGIIVNRKKGYILTCAHVVTEAPQSSIKVLHRKDNDRNNSTSIDARLVYSTPNELAYDVAMLRVKPKELDFSLRDIVIESARVPQGEIVAVVGYPFSSSSPSISRGNVAKFSVHMLQTTCCVPSGISGGPVVRWPTGQMLGMVVCNVLCPTQNVPQPRLNFAIPSLVLANILEEFNRTDDPKCLEKFTCEDESVQRDWELSFPPRAKL